MVEYILTEWKIKEVNRDSRRKNNENKIIWCSKMTDERETTIVEIR